MVQTDFTADHTTLLDDAIVVEHTESLPDEAEGLTGAVEREFQVLGPPGTGKTTYLARQVRRAVEMRGPGDVIIASFTNSAAAEIGSRDLANLPVDRVGTLHSHAYKAIGKPKVAESMIPDFLKWQEKTYGSVLVNLPVAGRRTLVDTATGTVSEAYGDGDPLLADLEMARRDSSNSNVQDGLGSMKPEIAFARYQLLRSKLLPRDHLFWSSPVTNFARVWEAWKRETGFVDFTDMIERAYREIDVAPGDPSIGFFDESQDFTPLQLALVRKWGQRMERFVLAGDDDQVLYSFTGATPGTFAIDVPEGHRRVLPKSYRVPARVLGFAERWVQQLGSRRAAKSYQPRNVIVGMDDANKPVYGDTIAEGAVYLDTQTTWLRPERMLQRIAAFLDRGESCMVLASASYMLDPTIVAMRDFGIPFHNPFREKNGMWNPLKASRGLRTADRVLAYFRPDPRVWGDDARPWTPDDLRAWTELIRARGLMTRGAKKAISELAFTTTVPEQTLLQLFERNALITLIQQPRDTLLESLADGKEKLVRYPLAIIERFGRSGIADQPRCVVGTIHSVKGGEADHVFIFPDISRLAGDATKMGNPQQRQDAYDALVRQFYVAITRARESVTICGSGGADSVNLSRYSGISS